MAVLVPLLLLLGAWPSFPGAQCEHFQMVEMVDRQLNVTFTKTVRFAENSSLADDIQLLDRVFAAEIAKKKAAAERKTRVEQNRNEIGELGLRILLVGDHSLYEQFVSLYGGDEYAAYNGLSQYLLGVFSQLETIFARLSFGGHSIRLELAELPLIILRPEDCPLRGPMLQSLMRGHRAVASNASSLSSLANLPPDNTTTAMNGTDAIGELNDTESWSRMDGLRAVQWTRRWIERSQEGEAVLPARDHVLVVTRLDLLSQRNDSATQGMAYVRAVCRGVDSVSVCPTVLPIRSHFWISVVEDVGGLSTATVAAHELSHSLGAFHDGAGASENCSARQNFLMAPVSASHTFSEQFGDTFPNAFVLSECSVRQIEQFLNSSDAHCLWRRKPPKGGPSSGGGHLPSPPAVHSALESANGGDEEGEERLRQREGGTSTNHQWTLDGRTAQVKPGEQFEPGRQCQIAFGANYGLCTRRDFLLLNADPCRRLWCKNRAQRRWAPCETKGFLPMMDGTRCGDGKWCLSGVCTSRTGKLAKSFSRSDCRDLNPAFCMSFSPSQLPPFCPALSFARVCCSSCRPFHKREKPLPVWQIERHETV